MPDLQQVFERLDLFDLVVAENGALIYRPATRAERLLVDAPSQRFIDELKRRGVERVSVGRCIVATWQPYEKIVLETIRDLGLELQVIFNKGAVMVLPGGMNKASGLKAALKELNISLHNSVGVGDAENDHAFLSICECSAAVANALPAVKDTADVVLESEHGAGVTELIKELLADDLASRASLLRRHEILLGKDSHWRRADAAALWSQRTPRGHLWRRQVDAHHRSHRTSERKTLWVLRDRSGRRLRRTRECGRC
jgi:hydroxymethylpyrimidine pyrophosphatase-like HAD family hydrolase